ncbi:hypothetical protein LCGC14_0273500 [marine sediment metagenome]|uniref:IPT/TIG domain-containing protein n=2 Tax=root TaxID=1 RepID=A0A9C9NKW2_9HYPH|nr:hypothetical protein [Aurantimonas coralicida]
MAAVITDVQPRSFRAGDDITVTGSGFSTLFADNRVSIQFLNAPLVSSTDTVMVCTVPAGIPTDEQVGVIASRIDTQIASEPFTAWSLASLDAIRDLDLSGQVPGPREAAHLDVDVADIAQARDYERIASHALRIANEILGSPGDIFTSDGSLPVPFPIGGGGLELHARPSEPLDLRWEAASRWLTFRYGLRFLDSQNIINMIGNGSPFSLTAFNVNGEEHGVPFEGNLTRVMVAVLEEEVPGDSLDRVRVIVNGASVHDSGAGLGLGEGDAYVATFSAPVRNPERVTIEATKLGNNAQMSIIGMVKLQETTSVFVSDTIFVDDDVQVTKTGNQAAAAAIAISVSDVATAALS